MGFVDDVLNSFKRTNDNSPWAASRRTQAGGRRLARRHRTRTFWVRPIWGGLQVPAGNATANFQRRGQAAIEILMLTGIFLLALGVIITFATHEVNQRITNQQAQKAVVSIVRAADSVYALGPGSVEYLTVTFPGGFRSGTVQGRSVDMQVSVHGAVSDFHARSTANLTGTIPQEQGTHRLRAATLDSGVVELSIP